jgi:outer membrane protein assembly factor BamB
MKYMLISGLLPVIALLGCANHPPTAPAVAGPSAGRPGDTLEYRAESTDPDEDAVSYLFTWGDASPELWTGAVQSGVPVTQSHVYPDSGQYQVRARARDTKGEESGLSEPLTVEIGLLPPDPPSKPDGPGAGTTRVSYEFDVTVHSPYGESLHVQFDWGGLLGDWSGLVPSGSAYAEQHAFDTVGDYSITAHARDRNGVASDWSPEYVFSVVSGQHPPADPTRPQGPEAAEQMEQVLFRTTTTDPEADSVSFQFDWDDGSTSDWSTLAASGDTIEMSHAWPLRGVYSVRARARDAFDNVSDWSPAWQIAVASNRPPDAPITPEGTTDTIPATVTFMSSASDPDDEQVSIRFLWGDGDTSDWSEFVPGATPVRMSHNYPEFGSYLVQAQARDTSGAMSGWSLPHTLNIGRLRWSFSTGDVAFAPVLSAGGNVIAVSRCGVTGVSPSGGEVWHWLLPGDTVATSSPALAGDGTLYFGVNGALRAGSSEDAEWYYPVAGLVVTTPALAADGSIIFGTTADTVFCLNPDGTLKWAFETGGEVRSSPAIGTDGTVYFGCNDDYFYALEPDGRLLWRYSTDRSDIESSPAIGADGTVYFGSDDHHVYAMDPDGTLKWKFRAGWLRVTGSPVVGLDGTVFCGAANQHLYAIRPDGSESWKFLASGAVEAAAAIDADSNIVLASTDGRVHVLSPDGAERWSQRIAASIGESPLIAGDGTIYVCDNSGNLHSLLGYRALADTPWPMYHHDPQHTGRAR